MAELHIIGQITEGINFEVPKIFCKWSLQAGNCWKIIEGESEGQTAVSSSPLENYSPFSYPLDIHFATRGIQGWPKLHVEVFAVNALNNSWPIGFGFVHIPTSFGYHKIEINTWKITPSGFFERIASKFWSGGYSVSKTDLIYSGLERYKLQTEASGKVVVELSLILRNFNKFGVEFE